MKFNSFSGKVDLCVCVCVCVCVWVCVCVCVCVYVCGEWKSKLLLHTLIFPDNIIIRRFSKFQHLRMVVKNRQSSFQTPVVLEGNGKAEREIRMKAHHRVRIQIRKMFKNINQVVWMQEGGQVETLGLSLRSFQGILEIRQILYSSDIYQPHQHSASGCSPGPELLLYPHSYNFSSHAT